jgi:hypothetical protein
LLISQNFQNWFYNSETNEHPDLGYFVGYAISKNYYANSKNKKQGTATNDGRRGNALSIYQDVETSMTCAASSPFRSTLIRKKLDHASSETAWISDHIESVLMGLPAPVTLAP